MRQFVAEITDLDDGHAREYVGPFKTKAEAEARIRASRRVAVALGIAVEARVLRWPSLERAR